jgi:hypothetical protein
MSQPDNEPSHISFRARIAELEAEVARLQAAATDHAEEKIQHTADLSAAQIGHRMAELRQIEAAAREAFVRSVLDANLDSSKVLTRDGRLEMLNVSSLQALEVDDAALLIERPWAELVAGGGPGGDRGCYPECRRRPAIPFLRPSANSKRHTEMVGCCDQPHRR